MLGSESGWLEGLSACFPRMRRSSCQIQSLQQKWTKWGSTRQAKHARRLTSDMWRRQHAVQGVPAHPSPPAHLPVQPASQLSGSPLRLPAGDVAFVVAASMGRPQHDLQSMRRRREGACSAQVGWLARPLCTPARASSTRSAWPATPGTWPAPHLHRRIIASATPASRSKAAAPDVCFTGCTSAALPPCR